MLSTLFLLKQQNKESFHDFLARFRDEIVNIDKVNNTLATIAMKEALIEHSPLQHNLVKYVEDIDDALVRAERYVRLEGIQKRPTGSMTTIFATSLRIEELRTAEYATPPLKRRTYHILI